MPKYAAPAPTPIRGCPAAQLLALELQLKVQLENKYASLVSGLNKLFPASDLLPSSYGSQSSGKFVSNSTFATKIGFLLPGVDPRLILTLASRFYNRSASERSSASISLPYFSSRISDEAAAGKVPPPWCGDAEESSRAEGGGGSGGGGEADAAGAQPSPPPPPHTTQEQHDGRGAVAVRLGRFREALRGGLCASFPQARRSMSLTERMPYASSSIDSELATMHGRSRISDYFEAHTKDGRVLSPRQWEEALRGLCAAAAVPPLVPADARALHEACKSGDVDALVDELFPPKASVQDQIALIRYSRGALDPQFRYAHPTNPNHVPPPPPPAVRFAPPALKSGAFDSDGSGARLVYQPPPQAIPAKISYRFSRTPVAPPSGFDPASIPKSGRPPLADLVLEQAHGFAGDRGEGAGTVGCVANGLHAADGGGTLLRALAAVVVVTDVGTKGQRFFREHDDDITAITVFDPAINRAAVDRGSPAAGGIGPLAASGQMGRSPYFWVWAIRSLQPLFKVGEGVFIRSVCSLAFSPDGRHVAGTGSDDSHTLHVWDLVGGRDLLDNIIPKLMASVECQQGTPPMITALRWASFSIPDSASVEGVGTVAGSLKSGAAAGRAPSAAVSGGTARSGTPAGGIGGGRGAMMPPKTAGSGAPGSASVALRPASGTARGGKSATGAVPGTAQMKLQQGPGTVQALVTCGKGKHLKFWAYAPTAESTRPGHPTGPLVGSAGKFKSAPLPKVLYDAAPISSKSDISFGDICAVGGFGQDGNGYIYLFKMSTATCISYSIAHELSPCHSLIFDVNSRNLISGGGDGMLHMWSTASGVSIERISSVDLNPPKAQKNAVSFLAHPSSLENDATIQCKRGNLKKKTVNNGADRGAPKAQPKMGSGLRGEGDEWIGSGGCASRLKITHIAVLSSSPPPPTAGARGPLSTVPEGDERTGSARGGLGRPGTGAPPGSAGGGGRGSTAAPKPPLLVAVGTARGTIYKCDVANGKIGETMQNGHCAHVYGLAPHPTDANQFLTVGEDRFLCLWDIRNGGRCLARRTLPEGATGVAYSPDGRHVAVGLCGGALIIIDSHSIGEKAEGSLNILFCAKNCEENCDELKYSPNGKMLAVGSHDNFIDLYDVDAGYTLKFRLKGHTSYITHIDWSEDSSMIQSNCGAYEILYWDARRGTQLRSTMDSVEADAVWSTWTCVLGFPVMGIWPDGCDGTDINAVHADSRRELLVTSDDYGGVNLLRYPAVVAKSASKRYGGHAAHVMNVRFLKGDGHVVSVGGKDRAVFIWRVSRNEHLADAEAKPKPRVGSRWNPSGGWDMGRELEVRGGEPMGDMIANADNPRACGWIRRDDKMVLIEPDMPYGGYKGRYNDGHSARA